MSGRARAIHCLLDMTIPLHSVTHSIHGWLHKIKPLSTPLWRERRAQKHPPQLRSYWQALGKGVSVGKSNMPPWVAPHWEVQEQHNLDLMGHSEIKDDTKGSREVRWIWEELVGSEYDILRVNNNILIKIEAGKMAVWSRQFTILPEDPDSIPRTHMVTQKHL